MKKNLEQRVRVMKGRGAVIAIYDDTVKYVTARCYCKGATVRSVAREMCCSLPSLPTQPSCTCK